MTAEDNKIMINQYLVSKFLFRPHDSKFVNVTQDSFPLYTMSINGERVTRYTVENIPTEIHSPKFTEIKSIYVAFQVGTHFQ